ncbi:hypothetical protein GQ600_21705 [Phytophthora cactorum]|nr:hypothetical protein GQ600_21705 [Phytophthora cactorum]
MTTLWSSSSEAAWAALWARYDVVLQSQSPPTDILPLEESDLATLDAWYLATFPPILRVREPEPYVTQQELQHLMEWKLKKESGARPQLMKFVSGLSESEVKQASLNAFKELKRGICFRRAVTAKAKWLNEQRAANDDEKAGDMSRGQHSRAVVPLCRGPRRSCNWFRLQQEEGTSPAAKEKRPTTPTPAKKKEEKPQEESAKDQDQSLRRSQRKRQRPAA